MKAPLRLTAATTAILATFVLCTTLQAAVIDKLDNADALNLGTSWDGGVVPGANDTARWPLAATQNLSTALGAPWAVGGIVVTNGANSTGYNSYNVTINGPDTLTLGSLGLDYLGKKALTVNSPISVAADQTWRCQGGGNLIVASSVALNGHTITLDGSNNKQVKGPFSGSGTFLGKLGQLKMSNGSAASDADLVLYRNSSVSFDTTPATDGACRFHDITLVGTGNGDGASVSGTGPTKSSGHDKISGTLSAEAGNGTIHLSPNSSHHLAFEASNVNIGEAGFLHFRGSNLGLHPAADHVPNSSSILFETSPSLVGGDGGMGSVTQPILPATVISTNNGDFGYTLATYDSTYGIRPLDPDTEYATALPLGQNTFENVRLVNDGTTGTPLQTLLPDGLTAINSLMLDVGGANGDGGYILDAATDATPTLRVNSGVVYVRNMKSKPNTAGDEIPFKNFTLDLNGHRGVFLSRQADNNNMQYKALELRSPIVNDGGNGVNFCSVQGRGFVYLYGSAESTYTGPTRLINGYLKLAKPDSVKNVSIPGDLEIYSGTCQNTGDTIPDSSDIRIYGGSINQRAGASNSGSGASETFRDLTMYGGSYTMGPGYSGGGSTTMRNAILFGGTLSLSPSHKHIVTGVLTLSGGTITIAKYTDSSHRTLQDLQGGISITNMPTGAYSPMVFSAGSGATVPGAKSTLSVGVTFAGNTTNDNTTVINAATPGEGIDWAQFLMNGALVFDIGDGAADIDLRIEPQLVDNGETIGSLTKRGGGTLALVNTNLYTGVTSVEAGVLVADGMLSGDVSVANGATFQAGDFGDTGKAALDGDLTLAHGARLRVRHDGTCATLGAVAGSVASAGTTYVAVEGVDKAAFKTGFKFMEASSITGDFVCTDPKVSVVKRNHGTELWLRTHECTVIMLQ